MATWRWLQTFFQTLFHRRSDPPVPPGGVPGSGAWVSPDRALHLAFVAPDPGPVVAPEPDPEPELSGEVTRPGMAHAIDGGVGRVIGYGPPDLWFFNSRWHSLSTADIDRQFAHPAQGDVTHTWVSLSTAPRAVMNEVLFDAREERAQVIDQLEYLIEKGIQPVCEAATQEFVTDHLRTDLSAIEDYLAEVGPLLRGRCKLAFPTRELHDLWRGSSLTGPERVKRYSRMLRALSASCGTSIAIGIHLGDREVPSTGLFAGLPRAYWLAQWGVRHGGRVAFVQPDDRHHDRTFHGVEDWLKYWTQNRMDYCPNMHGSIAFEHSIPPTAPNAWGVTKQTLPQARVRGRACLRVPECVADFSGGATR